MFSGVDLRFKPRISLGQWLAAEHTQEAMLMWQFFWMEPFHSRKL